MSLVSLVSNSLLCLIRQLIMLDGEWSWSADSIFYVIDKVKVIMLGVIFYFS